mgnify:CR=1 FL=1
MERTTAGRGSATYGAGFAYEYEGSILIGGEDGRARRIPSSTLVRKITVAGERPASSRKFIANSPDLLCSGKV